LDGETGERKVKHIGPTDYRRQLVAILTDQLAAMSSKHQEAQEDLRGQLGLAQQDLTRVLHDLTTALAQVHTQVADLNDRLKARSNQQATSLTELSPRFQQQLDSSRANDERISQSLRQRHWTEAQIITLMSPSIVGCAGG
jgi:uncharacterized phage infection (PIP) family protein YhgE